MLITWIIVIVVVLILVIFFVTGFNKLRSLKVGASEGLSGIDVQLTKRADLIPNLVETVKGYAKHESEVFEKVTEARAGMAAALKGTSVEARAQAQATLDRAIFNVNAVAEAYPDLKASTNFLDLQNQLASTEKDLAFARQYYNDAAAQLNKAVSTLPWLLFKGVTGVSEVEFYKAPEGQATPPTVSF